MLNRVVLPDPSHVSEKHSPCPRPEPYRVHSETVDAKLMLAVKRMDCLYSDAVQPMKVHSSERTGYFVALLSTCSVFSQVRLAHGIANSFV